MFHFVETDFHRQTKEFLTACWFFALKMGKIPAPNIASNFRHTWRMSVICPIVPSLNCCCLSQNGKSLTVPFVDNIVTRKRSCHASRLVTNTDSWLWQERCIFLAPHCADQRTQQRPFVNRCYIPFLHSYLFFSTSILISATIYISCLRSSRMCSLWGNRNREGIALTDQKNIKNLAFKW